MTDAEEQRPARVTPTVPQTPLKDIVAATAKAKYLRINPYC